MIDVSSSPHFHDKISTSRIMRDVSFALMPSCLWGCAVFGFKAVLVMVVSILSSVLTEFLLNRLSGERTIYDCSALVTGILVGMNMNSDVPLYIPVIASVFAIGVVKWTFGGLGCNWANPAIAGRIFVFFSFTSGMTRYAVPICFQKGSLLVSQASPLSLIKTAVVSGEAVGKTTVEILSDQGFPFTSFAGKISSLTGLNPYDIDAFIGFIPGTIGEVSKILLILGAVYLLLRKVISLHVPLSLICVYSLFTWVFGGIPLGNGLFHGEVLSNILRGGIIIGSFFMATDMVTCPVTGKGKVIFGAGCGFISFLFRTFGSLPESVSVAILMMNMVSPTIDRFIKPKRFGMVKKNEVTP